ncbi:type II secretion system F family protein [Enterococcus sp. BWB1-3]|uniref:competence type IV pilus assembly protein ComGB n=1 Tax=unclassified Enterococcus TaxID=2608891 RepID=UPI001924D089|nr:MULTISPECIES: competence type IV pilus assembly protein ComGB [unclassified Enterococcus]MBL1228198.1 type II secretion system F family protein [Enterococcus sp. BWB1-3]MCB5951935.1 type II secretion system F family protein [Enterococcus sp. BWT-B8]
MAILMISLFRMNSGSKLSKKQSAALFKLLAELLKNGFSINESFVFMKKAKVFPEKLLTYLIGELENGEELAAALFRLGISAENITQIEFAQKHGDLSTTLQGIEEHMNILQKQRESLSKILIYPLILLFFLFSALLGMRQFLLPQLEMSGLTTADNPGIRFVRESPYYISGFLLLSFFSVICLILYLRRKTMVERSELFARIPVIRSYYIQYTSAFFALEWGKLFSQGMEIKQIISVMKELMTASLMKELSVVIENRLIEGLPVYDQLDGFPFLAKELSMIIRQGEVKGNLGKELMIYSSICRKNFFIRIEKLIQWIQPIIFLIIALAVVSIYAAMLLPIYGGIENL